MLKKEEINSKIDISRDPGDPVYSKEFGIKPKEKEIMQKNFSVTTGNKSGTAASVGELYSPTDVTATAQLVFVFRLKVKQSESKIYLGWTKQYFVSFGSVTSSTIKCSLLPLAMRPLAFAVI